MLRVIFILFSIAAWGEEGGVRCQIMTFYFLLFPPDQQTSSGIRHHVKKYSAVFFGLATNDR